MKFIVIGLGNFGAALSINLTQNGHEVIAADYNMDKVEAFKEGITHTIMINARDMTALKKLPIKDSDAVIVGIGEDFGASVEVTANVKQLGAKKLISRAITPVHQTVLEAIGVDEIIHPEEETAVRFAKRLEMTGIIDIFDLGEGYRVIEAKVPERFIGKTVVEVNVRKNFNINIITIIKKREVKNLLGATHTRNKVTGVVSPVREFEENDILVLFGNQKDIDRMLED